MTERWREVRPGVVTRVLRPPARYDLARTLRRLALIPGEPTVCAEATEAWWATRTPDGPGTLHLARSAGELVATGYGPGKAWLLDRAGAIAGLDDDVTGFPTGRHPLVDRLWREYSGLRLPSTGQVFHHVVPAILGQKVTGKEASRGYRRLLATLGEAAPGPNPALRVPPAPETLAATPYWAFHPWGVEQRRADTIRRAAAHAAGLGRATDPAEATRRMTALPGIGPWTAAEVVRVAYGDPDAVSVGDYHIKNTVAWALAGEVRGTDDRMLELLEPFQGHRGRVCLLLESAGLGAPRFGPRMPIRSFAHF
jgi:3-methyladenine DNA glycosylase/8-oxoguanine DNA glycosylase